MLVILSGVPLHAWFDGIICLSVLNIPSVICIYLHSLTVWYMVYKSKYFTFSMFYNGAIHLVCNGQRQIRTINCYIYFAGLV